MQSFHVLLAHSLSEHQHFCEKNLLFTLMTMKPPGATSPATETYHVPLLIVLIFDDEDHVKSGQDGRHEVNIVLPFCLIPSAKY